MAFDTTTESGASGVHWTAIIGGAFAAAGITIILAPIGAALGVWADSSPWHSANDSSKTFTAMAAIWLIIVQWLASGIGGYITGRLRTVWTGAHTHEVFFRDTVHGFLSWTVASVSGALILAMTAVHTAATSAPLPGATATPASGVVAASVLVCLSLLIGAFIASVAGALGGRHRDKHYATGSLRD
jgi:hypothetical protein